MEDERRMSTEENEGSHYRRVIEAFDQYRRYSLATNNRRRKDLHRLPLEDQSLLSEYPAKLAEVDDRIRRNADVLDQIVFKAELAALGPSSPLHPHLQHEQASGTIQIYPPPQPCCNRVVSPQKAWLYSCNQITSPLVSAPWTLRNRFPSFKWPEWVNKLWVGVELIYQGSAEREACYSPILQRLDRLADSLAIHVSQRAQIRVLVPGSGLARLVWEIANRGFTAQGNEVSYPMLLASNLILNHSESVDQWSIYPFIHSFSNLSSIHHLLQEVRFPDVVVPEVLNRQDFGISVGEFVDIFSKPEEHGKWDAIVTCFFLDTAQNIVAYLRTMYAILKTEGIWINLGPTLWHYESTANPRDLSIELDVSEIKQLAKQLGFHFEPLSERVIETTYAGNPYNNLQQSQ
ncbi:hypothetical protein VP01_1227g1 [Puccinia sorghi]|uniref:carnosine N-methyltransferase n=1 Tax=Puccinia sorghi TaxID=27349 RepID=A0A0L6VPV3_9BASI|nr:hypothetical protein VP01_1227g1 [Puccinia sorghi]